jgi:hypothetical protein
MHWWPNSVVRAQRKTTPIKHSDEVLKTTMKVAEIFARMVGNDHKMAHSIANGRESMPVCRSCP